MMNKELQCFTAYDVRGILGDQFNTEICYSIGRAFASVLNAKTIVVGRDSRASSSSLLKSFAQGLIQQGVKVLDIGLAGTEEMYWATSHFEACGGVEVTASHNPINYNGLKMVKERSQPLDPNNEFLKIKQLAEKGDFALVAKKGIIIDVSPEAKKAYVRKVLSFIDEKNLGPLKISVNSGNGTAGPTLDLIIQELSKGCQNISFEKIHHVPDSSFPNGIPNPLLSENHAVNKKMVLENNSNLGIAFDGDFDRCFFFDEKGSFIQGQFVVGLLSEIFLSRYPNSKIAHDPRIIWNIQEIVRAEGGSAIMSKTGHAFVKQTMRKHNCVYGGELSAHHYFKDFAYCDSGMIPWLLIIELMCKKGKKLSDLVNEQRIKFPSSPELNYKLKDPNLGIRKLKEFYSSKAVCEYHIDGMSLDFEDWRFNVRVSNTEPILRVNLETKENLSLLNRKINEINTLLKSHKRF